VQTPPPLLLPASRTVRVLASQYEVVDPIPDTPYTVIPGGRQIFWGMAFNKLLVFGMTKYRKLLWMDADAYVVRNIDHLMKEPMLTGACMRWRALRYCRWD